MEKNKKISFEERQKIIEICQNINISADKQDWENYVKSFAKYIMIDYSSYFDYPPIMLTREQNLENAKLATPAFDFCMHFMNFFEVTINENHAFAKSHVKALHVINGAEGGDLLILSGIYDFSLEKVENEWKVNGLKFIYKAQEGNKNLFAISAKRTQKSK